MKIGANVTAMNAAVERKNFRGTRSCLFETKYQTAMSDDAQPLSESRLQGMSAADEGDDKEDGKGGACADRAEATKIYEAAVSGKNNPIENMRHTPKVPYGHLAKDGVIVYNGVTFVCDEKTNSICLGDMTDEKNVLNIPLSGGGHLKVNRNSLGQLSRAAGMFSPEDLNLIMRAVAQDTKCQAVQKEIEDTEASVGNRLTADGGAGQAEEPGQAEYLGQAETSGRAKEDEAAV